MTPAPPFRRATIIAVGSELLTPSRMDTNSLAITEALNGIGIEVVAKMIVGDSRLELDALLAHALARADLVIVTGGLGPTDDDLTRDVVAAHLGLPLEEDREMLDTLRQRFASRGWTMPEVNRRQAQVPRGALVLPNRHGTAPGLWLEHAGKGIALLPGPPRELRPMLEWLVAERFAPRTAGMRLRRRVLKVAGRAESRVEELTQPIYSRWRDQSLPIETTILAAPGQIELHLSAAGQDEASMEQALDRAVSEIAEVLKDDLFSRDGRTLEEVVGDLLRSRRWRIALAESCTGGLATSRLTDVSGSSDYVERSIVAYSNDAKVALLDVPPDMLVEHGAVSEPVAAAMADGIRVRAGVDVGVGITGIAGPTGGTPDKPVGTVCIAVALGDGTRVRTFRFLGNRDMVKIFSAFTAIDLVRRTLLGASSDVDWVKR